MKRAKYIFRIVFFLLAISLLVYLNRKADNSIGKIANFKYKMIEKLQKDSLNSKQKINLLVNETTKFIDNSAPVRNGIRYLIGLVGLIVVTEVGFFMLEKRNSKRQEIK